MNRQQRAIEAERLYAEGLNLVQVGERLGVSHMTIWKDLQARGVQMRPSLPEIIGEQQIQRLYQKGVKAGRLPAIPDGLKSPPKRLQ